MLTLFCMIVPAFSLTTSEIFSQYSSSVVTIYAMDSGQRIHQGSGFFIDKTGHILTNYHIIHDSQEMLIETEKGNLYKVREIVAQDAITDLALLISATPPNEIRPLDMAKEIPKPGSRIITIGTPEGFSHSISEGIMSSVTRGAKSDIIQFTAPVSSGSSGSPLLDELGLVIGIVTFQHMKAQNLNFAMSKEAILQFLKDKPQINQRDAELAQRATQTDINYEMARRSSAIFKSGEYKDTYVYRLNAPFKSTMPGAVGIHFWFEFTEPCDFYFVGIDNKGYEIFLPSNKVMRANYAGISVLAKGDIVGIYRNAETHTLGWFVDNSNLNYPAKTIWSRLFKEKEYSLFTVYPTVKWHKEAEVFIVKYIGLKDNIIAISTIDSRTGREKESIVEINIDDLPGYFDIAGGRLDIKEVTGADGYSILHYTWVTLPK